MEHHAGMPADGTRRRLCVCIDDVGLHAGIHEAALQLTAAQRVHAIGTMVGAPAWREAAAAWRREGDRHVDVGLHLDLTEFPLLRRTRRPLAAWLLLSALGRVDPARLRWEIRAQLDAFESALGRAPDFVDGHQHVHQLPGVREALLEELERRGAGYGPWLRRARLHPPLRRGKGWVIEHAGVAGLETLARRAGLRQNATLLGVYDFRGGARRYRQLAAGWLRAATDGDLLMCHPSLPLPAAAAANDPLHEARCAELSVWSSAEILLALRRQRIELAPMSRILAADAGPAPP